MAAEILMRGSCYWKRLPRLFTASETKIDALLTAGEFIADPEQLPMVTPVRIFLLDVIHDDPAMLGEVLVLAARDDETGKAARIILEETGEVRPDACALLREAFGGTSREMQISLLKGFANRAICDPSFTISDHAAWLRDAASHIAAPIYFWQFDVEDVIAAATQACAGQHADHVAILTAAQTALTARRTDLRDVLRLRDTKEIDTGLKAFLEHSGSIGSDGRPIRDGAADLEALLTGHGPTAVKLLGTWLRQFLLTENDDYQLLGALAFATAQASLRFPDQAALALFGPSDANAQSPNHAKERELRRQMQRVFKDRPTSLAGASLLILAAKSGCIGAEEVTAILNGALSPNPVSDRRVENILRQVKEVDDSALGALEDAMVSPSLRKRRLAIRLLGAFLRTPANPGASLRQAVDLLTRYAYTSDGRPMPFGIDSRTEDGDGAFLFKRQSLGETALRELRRAWS
jgi:hypothetical protein